MARKKPVGWKGESMRHSLARRGIPTVQKRPSEDVLREMEEERKPFPILAMAKAEAIRRMKESSPYAQHLALAQMGGFTPLSREEFEARRHPAMAARV